MAFFSICSICGKKKPSFLLNDKGICSVCNREITLKKQKQEEKQQEAEKAIAREYYAELVELFKKADVDNLYLVDSFEDAMSMKTACDSFASLLSRNPEIKYFKDIFSEHCAYISSTSCQSNDFGTLKVKQVDSSTICVDLDTFIKRMQNCSSYLQKHIENTVLFQETAQNIPLVNIIRNPNMASHPQAKETKEIFIEPKNITKRTPLKKLETFFVVDLETTGLNPIANEIIQISAIKFVDFSPVEAFSTYVKPRHGLQAKAQAVNRITEADVKDAPYIEEIVGSFKSFINAQGAKLYAPIVGHNIKFDIQFLVANNCLNANLRDYYDTLELSRRTFKNCPLYKLDYLVQLFLEIFRPDAHSAFSDALATGLLFKKICELRMDNMPIDIDYRIV